MALRPLKTEGDYDLALKEIAKHFEEEPVPGTPDGDRFDILALLIADYEAKHWAIEPPEAPDAIRDKMERSGFKQTDLAALLGSKSRASEVLNRRRYLTLDQAWKLHKEWGIPAESLVRPYPLRGRAEAA